MKKVNMAHGSHPPKHKKLTINGSFFFKFPDLSPSRDQLYYFIIVKGPLALLRNLDWVHHNNSCIYNSVNFH